MSSAPPLRMSPSHPGGWRARELALTGLAVLIAASIFAADRLVPEPGLHPEVLYGAGMLPLFAVGRRRPLLAYAAAALALTWIDVAADAGLPDLASAALVGGMSSLMIALGTGLALRLRA